MISRYKNERSRVVDGYRARNTPQELDVIDGRDCLKVTTCVKDSAAWWLGTLRAVYPQDHYSTGNKDEIKMHPEVGVTLKLNRSDGSLTIKGDNHLEWFKNNFDTIIEVGQSELQKGNEFTKTVDNHLKISTGHSLPDMLSSLPPDGAYKHGPTFIYRLWKLLLNAYIGTNGSDVYVVTPLLDGRRLADILLSLIKHRLTKSRVHLYILNRCNGDSKYSKVRKEAFDILLNIKAPNKNRLLSEERIRYASQRLQIKFGRFHCKMLAMRTDQRAEFMSTSANFHRLHFEDEGGDTVRHTITQPSLLTSSYIGPLGLDRQPDLSPQTNGHRGNTSASSEHDLSGGGDLSSRPPHPQPQHPHDLTKSLPPERRYVAVSSHQNNY